ncbi:MAG TPA: hypothetical protein VFB80_22410 [Pirellulaceae bacterium]|nr:hypothetical protein [Pirellulaceae bacterium]
MKSRSTDQRLIRPPQFGLRTLLLVVTACSVLFALGHWLSPIAFVGLLLLVASITLHVAGNAIGTRLRELGDRPPPDDAAANRAGEPRPLEFASATRLSERQGLGWVIYAATIAGTLAGGIGGGVWTWLTSREPAGLLQLAVGVMAFAVLGGLAAFAAAAFTQVLLGALWQALHPLPAARPTSLASADGARDNPDLGHSN